MPDINKIFEAMEDDSPESLVDKTGDDLTTSIQNNIKKNVVESLSETRQSKPPDYNKAPAATTKQIPIEEAAETIAKVVGEKPDRNALQEVLEQPSNLVNKGLSQFADNPLAGSLNIVHGVAQTALLPITAPFTALDSFLRDIGAEPVANAVAAPFELASSGVIEGQKGIDNLIDLFAEQNEGMIPIPNANGGINYVPVEQFKNFGLSPEAASETAEAISGINQLGAQLLVGKGIHSASKAISKKAGVESLGVKDGIEAIKTNKGTRYRDQKTKKFIAKEKAIKQQEKPQEAKIEGDVPSGGESLTLLKRRGNERLEQRANELTQKYLDENVSPEMIDAGTFPRGVIKRVSESTLLSERIKTLEQGAKLGAKDMADALSEVQTKVIDYARENLPKSDLRKSEVTPIMTKIRDAKNVKQLKEAYQKINQVVEKVEKRELIGQINTTLKRITPTKDKSGKPSPKVSPDAQKTINKIKIFSKSENKGRIENFLKEIAEKDEFDITIDQIQDIHLMKTFGDIKNKSNTDLAKAKAELDYLVQRGKTELQKKLEARKSKDDLLRRATTKVVQGEKSTLRTKELTEEQIRSQREDLTTLDKAKELLTGIRTYTKSSKEGIAGTYDTMMQGWETLLDKMSRRDKGSAPGESFITQYFGRKVHESYVTEQSGIRQKYETITGKAQEIFGAKGRALDKILSENSKPQKTGIKLKQGDKSSDLYLSQNEAGYIYQLSKNPKIRRDLAKQGYTEGVIRQLEDWIKPDVKRWADWQMKDFYDKGYKEVNQVHRDLMGVDIPKVENYAPTARETNVKGLETDLETGQNFYSSIYKHYFKERSPNTAKLKIQDMDTVLLNYMLSMEHFKGWSGTVRELRSVFGDKNVTQSIKLLHGSKQYNTLNRFMNDFARGGIDKVLTNKSLDRLRGRITKAKLGLNIPVFFKQQASLPAYLFNLGAKDFAKGLVDFHRNPKKAIETLSQSEYLKARYGAGWDIEIIQAMRRDTHKKLAGVDNYTDKLMFPTRLGDRVPILAGGWTVYKTKYNEYITKGIGKERAHKKAMTDFERATDLTQQSGTLQSLSEIQRMGSVARMFTMFMTAQNQYYRQMSSAVRNLRAGRGSKTKQLKKIALGHVVLPMAFQFVADGFRFDEKRQLRAAITGGTNGIFIAADLVESTVAVMQEEYWMQPGLQTPVADLLAKTRDIVKNTSKQEWMSLLDEISGFAGDVTGVPYDPVKRMVSGFIDEMSNGDNLWDGIRITIGFGDYAIDKKESGTTTTKPFSRGGIGNRPFR